MSIKEACVRILDQLSGALHQIRSEDFSRASETLSQSTIGQHFRHTLEFFLCLEVALQTGRLSYDERFRDRLIETDKSVALECIGRVREFVTSISGCVPLQLQTGYDPSNDSTVTIDTNSNRELAYNIEHAVHHMALIKVGIKELAPYVVLDHDFGVAASTLRWKENAPEMNRAAVAE